MDERWLPVVGYEGLYEVSDLGSIRRLPRQAETRGRWGSARITLDLRVMTLSTTTAGYRYIGLRQPNKPAKKHLVHRLVLAAFVGPAEGRQGNHLDGDKSHNALANLEYCTSKENLRHCIDVLGKKRGSSLSFAKLTEQDVISIRADTRTLKDIGAQYGVSLQMISRIKRRTAWTHVHHPQAAA